ncbi:hypothetical protein C9374_011164 [Naegleria lovaniensis]|uniref:Uncharacterized protein n=1 Tax=Naegleria lovaniensis TaxID=51637 RepID=A0AA88G9W3_NAELO|nr:uncharacterized protein C9374_011164 [Naegleria lovaniensis]KAG2374085.1 hypothetical protein C9374_011164 [Naegleria lovaniensis]
MGCMFMKMLTNCSLRLNEEYLKDFYGNRHDVMNYFSEYGSYFHMAVATLYGEAKLHHALYKQLDKHIDPSWKVNDILGRCLMTNDSERF